MQRRKQRVMIRGEIIFKILKVIAWTMLAISTLLIANLINVNIRLSHWGTLLHQSHILTGIVIIVGLVVIAGISRITYYIWSFQCQRYSVTKLSPIFFIAVSVLTLSLIAGGGVTGASISSTQREKTALIELSSYLNSPERIGLKSLAMFSEEHSVDTPRPYEPTTTPSVPEVELSQTFLEKHQALWYQLCFSLALSFIAIMAISVSIDELRNSFRGYCSRYSYPPL